MKNTFVSLLAAIASSLVFLSVNAQTKFEQGYFVDRQGQRTECLIKNSDWVHTPRVIRYKASDSGGQQSMEINQLKEFGVNGTRYVCMEVKLDTSSQDTKTYSNSRAPQWDTRYVALKVMVAGKATLYHFDDGTLALFFYSVDNSLVEQLEFKNYNFYVDREKYMKQGQNLNYINQLKEKMSCGDVFTRYAINKFRYKSDFLIDYFNRYNKCSGGDQEVITEAPRKKEKFRLRITPGLNLATAKILNVYTSSSTKFSDKEPAFRIGADAEFVLPFKNNKWSIFIEPTYMAFKTDSPLPIDYTAVEIPLGARHYFYLNDDVTIFLDAAIVFDLVLDLEVQVTASQKASLTNTRQPSSAFGLGVSFKRFSLEGRYYAPRSRHNFLYESTYKQTAIIAGFRLF